MKRFMSIILLFYMLFALQPVTLAAESNSKGDSSVYDTIKQGDKEASPPEVKTADSETPSLFPLFLKFILSFAVVILLLVWLLRFLSKKNRLLPAGSPVLPLGGHMLGNNKSVQVLLIGQTIYVIGVGDDVTLIRTISQGEEYQRLLEGFETQADGGSLKSLTLNTKSKWNRILGKHLQKIDKANGEGQDE
ncbi:flagellar biosynthetic protein FliO [Neobacillus muris]|uniref:flagellar biosynthetic protein FliO n=1 Tax=Neobacillus muris TaxID=2941334 RepID=UPI00203ED877|nr:flagellar biosynthetic protein FliO [Neobacillus muris]